MSYHVGSLQASVSIKKRRVTESVGKTSKLHFEKESVVNTSHVTLSKSIWRYILDTDFNAERGEHRAIRAPQVDLRVILGGSRRVALSSSSLRIASLPQPLPPGGPRKQYFLAQQDKTSHFHLSFPHVAAPCRGPRRRWISPGCDLLSPGPRLLCIP